MSEPKIRGRNLIRSGRFQDGWADDWKQLGESGSHGRYEDPYYGYYLNLNGQAVFTQSFDSAEFSVQQLNQVNYTVAFRYENAGDFAGAKIVIKAGLEHEILLGAKSDDAPEATWREYPEEEFKVLPADKGIEIQIHGAKGGGSSGLQTTDYDVQIHLPPLVLGALTLDGRDHLATNRASSL